MKRIRICQMISLLILFLVAVFTIVMVSIKSNYKAYYNYLTVLVIVTMAIPLDILVFLLIKEIKIFDYKSKDFYTFFMFLIIIIGVFIYMALIHFVTKESFIKFQWIFYASLPLAIIIPYITYKIINKKKDNKNLPKFIKR